MEHFSWFSLAGLIKYDHILGAVLVVLFILFIGLRVKKHYSREESVIPEEKLSINIFFELVGLEFFFNTIENIFGSREKAKKYFPLLAGSFFFILFANLLGMVPGFLPPTGNLNTTVACSLLIFVMYNYYGIKEHGLGYIKHFLGPVIFLAPLMLIIEIVSHLVRPLSLSLRLFMNITGDHMVLGVFTNLTHIVIPMAFVALGIFVSFLQAFIFTMLSTIYIALAEAHEH
ncbi:MAG: F0F1 ATP synthase subunit A [Candidatus Dadabacteria bacterium]|nr:F0F1 ATP synthase subunit A [Candidatus Dadabacteria bacterium]MCY4262580.1 F0F1 ATP synthase subunit A [Candidatus Dadabacteria bacterium]